MLPPPKRSQKRRLIDRTIENEITETIEVMNKINANAKRVLRATETIAERLGEEERHILPPPPDPPIEPGDWRALVAELRQEVVREVIAEIMPILEALKATEAGQTDQVVLQDFQRRMEQKMAARRGRILASK